jgi:spore germination cell wall hydrolase CwlJ-like protein
MRAFPRNLVWLITGIAIGAGSAFIAAEAGIAESGSVTPAPPALINAALIADPAVAIDNSLLADDTVTFSSLPSSGVNADTAAPKPAFAELDSETECMAKVVRHEAANQSRRGQLAVAQIMMNRVRSGRFASTICRVAGQPGQFFDVNSYNPPRDNIQWRTAVEVAREAIAGEEADVTNGAYFYHAASQSPTGFFRNRQRVQTLGDHIFYR